MKIFFLGDIVGKSGRLTVIKNLKDILEKKKIDFVVVNGENAADQGVGITEAISNDLFNSGVDVITTGNHVWDQKEIINHIERETRLLRPENLSNNFQPQLIKYCEWKDCNNRGKYKAPKSRENLREFMWFCLNHIKEYNSNWDYFSGLSQNEIEKEVKDDYTWHLPTWPMGKNFYSIKLAPAN